MISSVRLPTALVLAPKSVTIVLVFSHSCRTPFSQRCYRQCRPSIFRQACVFGQTVEQALTVSDHSDGQVLPPSIRQAKLFQSLPHTTLLACILPSPQNPCHTSHISDFACRTLSSLLSESDSRHTCRFPFGLVAKPDPSFHIVRHSPDSLSTVQGSIVIGPLHIFDVIFAEGAKNVRFGLVAVVCCSLLKACRHVR